MKKNIEPRSIKILSLGDSYTIGTGVEAKDRWPSQLAASLRTIGFDVPEPAYIAQNGWTTTDLLDEMSTRKSAGDFDIVTLLIGVNNQYQGLNIRQYTREFQLLLQKAINFANGDPGRVVVLSIPDWSVTPFAERRIRINISREIDQYNDVNRRLSTGAGAQYVDITTLTRQSGAESVSLADDLLHPSAFMYAAWVRLVFPVVLNMIG